MEADVMTRTRSLHRRCLVLNDHEREVLHDLERDFNPHREAGGQQHTNRLSRKHFGFTGALLIMITLILGGRSLVAGSLTAALMFWALATVIWWAWMPEHNGPERFR